MNVLNESSVFNLFIYIYFRLSKYSRFYILNTSFYMLQFIQLLICIFLKSLVFKPLESKDHMLHFFVYCCENNRISLNNQ